MDVLRACLILVLAAALVTSCDEPSDTDDTLSPTPTPTVEPTPTAVPPATDAATPSPSREPTSTPSPTPTATPEPTSTLTPTPTITPTPTPIPKQDILDYVRWEIGDKVSSDHRNEAMQGVQLAHDYSVLLGMPKIQSEITIHIYYDTEKLLSAYARETNGVGRGIFMEE